MKKRLLIMGFALMLSVGLVMGVNAEEVKQEENREYTTHLSNETVSFHTINPLYKNVDSREITSEQGGISAEAGVLTEEAAIEYLKQQMLDRVTSVSFTLEMKDYELGSSDFDQKCDQYIEKIFNESTGSCEGDYLRYSVYSWSGGYHITGGEKEGMVTCHMTFDFTYFTSKDQENELGEVIKSVKQEILTSDMSDYEKTKAMHDYIAKNVTYDYAGLNDDADLTKYTAYGALVEKSAVCQGYATLLYRMLKEEGINTLLVSSESLNHAWNAVELNGLYYYVDVTWDSNIFEASGQLQEQFFLKGQSDFTEHEATDTKYDSIIYQTFYPLATSTYNVSNPEQKEVDSALAEIGQCGDRVIWKRYQTGKLQIIGDGQMWDIDQFDQSPWEDKSDSINEIIVEDGITRIGDCAFRYMGQVEKVTLAESVRTIGVFSFLDCVKLKEITFPRELAGIEQQAFDHCDSLKEVTIPGRVTYFGGGEFDHCENLQKIVIEWDDDFAPGFFVNCIGPMAENCSNLKEIKVSENHPYFYDIDGVLFAKEMSETGETLTRLQSYPAGKEDKIYSIPEGTTFVSRFAARNVEHIKQLRIPKSLQIIEMDAFVSVPLEKIVFAEDGMLSEIEEYAFAWSEVSDIELPNSLETIGDAVFYSVEPLERVVINENVKVIGRSCFAAQPGQKDNLKYIFYKGTKEQFSKVDVYPEFLNQPIHYNTTDHLYGDWGVAEKATCEKKGSEKKYCSVCKETQTREIKELGHDWNKQMTVDKEATYLSEGSQSRHCLRCTAQKEVSKIPFKKPSVSELGVDEKSNGTYKITIFSKKKKEVSYEKPDNKSKETCAIPDTIKGGGNTYKVTKVSKGAFQKNTKVKQITIGKNVQGIGANAFNGCKKLKTLTIKTTKLTSKNVEKNAFKGLTKATTIKVPKKKVEAYKELFKKKGLSSKVVVKAY